MKRAMDLNKNSLFMWQNTIYIVLALEHDNDPTFLTVQRIAGYWTEPRNEWVGVINASLERFNGYCEVTMIPVPAGMDGWVMPEVSNETR